MGENIVCGRNAVNELLKSGNPVNKIVMKSEKENGQGRNADIVHRCKERGIPFQFVDNAVLDKLSAGEKHQGIVALSAAKEYVEPSDIIAIARQKGEDPFILVLDEIEDPHNLGALLRTADAAGVHGVIIPKRRSVGLTPAVGRTSAGAIEYVPVARVANLVQTLKYLKDEGCWVSGAEAGGKDIYQADLKGPRVVVIGGEDKGLGRLVKETCDEVISLPMLGRIASLNASVAGSIILYEVLRQRNKG
ncbi:23S rRNA (guanosine(2251)-2'-O)-methyltransferase RlmB [Dehalobacter sp. DCM]|uniref:23S rRNA (guanosine(2251)-2'-O)-methyltransferase RlmB n=1 Tax=Dehalobacter sp. DCM TaxID=2907827 RepID=UPI00308206B5|nr:23S rRNA (guanosine(2251)-2'-O)-methyltransferase RlmB [Dehalobacter sp. DCM]